MEKKQEYIEHLKEANDFTKEMIREHKIPPEFARVIFDKITRPHHFFIQSKQPTESKREKQLKLAKDLEIENPEQYSGKELYDLIKEKLDKQ